METTERYIFRHLDSLDNIGLPKKEWIKQMKYEILSYNEKYGSNYKWEKILNEYLNKRILDGLDNIERRGFR